MIDFTTASRELSPKNRGSQVGSIVDPFRRRQIVFESGLEQSVAYVLVADPEVVLVEDQPECVTFIGADGYPASHVFDFRVTTSVGKRIAIAVKYREDAARTELHALLERVAAQCGGERAFADEYRIMTEEHVDAVRVANARLVVSCGSDFDIEARRVVKAYLRSAPRQVRLADIGRRTGLGARGYRAAVALFQSGSLSVEAGTLISPIAIGVNRLFNSD